MFPTDSRILVVDDMSFVRSVLKKLLRDLGYADLRDAENGEKGLGILHSQIALGMPIDLVLSDWNMPVMTGIDLLRAVRSDAATFGDLPFVLITAEGELHQVKEALQLSVSGYIRKPFTPDGVKEHLTSVWKRHQSNKATAARSTTTSIEEEEDEQT